MKPFGQGMDRFVGVLLDPIVLTAAKGVDVNASLAGMISYLHGHLNLLTPLLSILQHLHFLTRTNLFYRKKNNPPSPSAPIKNNRQTTGIRYYQT
ncbi:MAG: hypothetical protein ACYSO7_11910, partial [Planctomycetota bacterium]